MKNKLISFVNNKLIFWSNPLVYDLIYLQLMLISDYSTQCTVHRCSFNLFAVTCCPFSVFRLGQRIVWANKVCSAPRLILIGRESDGTQNEADAGEGESNVVWYRNVVGVNSWGLTFDPWFWVIYFMTITYIKLIDRIVSACYVCFHSMH